MTRHFLSSKITCQPTLHNTLIPSSDSFFISGTMCSTRVNGKSGIVILHMCVDVTFFLSKREIVMRFSASLLFLHEVPTITKTDVPTVSAMAWVGLIIMVCACSERHCLVAETFDVTTILLSSSAMPTIEAATIIVWVGYNK